MKKKANKKILIAVIAAALCLGVSVPATMAYFSDYEAASGGAVMKLGGQTEIEEGNDQADKAIVIENTGDTNMVVRMAIYGPEKYMTISHDKGDASLWEKIGDFYYYKKVLLPGEKTPQVDAKLKVEWQGTKPDYNFQITVVHESAQAVYNGRELATPAGWDDISQIVAPAPLPVDIPAKAGEAEPAPAPADSSADQTTAPADGATGGEVID